jgi:hypothetical protein
MPSIMTGYAEALAITNNRVLKGRPMELVLQALEADPDDMKGLELAGIHAFQDRISPRPLIISSACTSCCRLSRPMPRIFWKPVRKPSVWPKQA